MHCTVHTYEGSVPICYDVYIAYIRRIVDINVLMFIAIFGAMFIQELN